ncbi:MAG TPA: histidine phosphatase family protein, partial [bacterium]|nr:histidine phosphatase family protein [bacterium]
ARHPGGTVAVVAHGGLNKTILLALLGAPLGRYWTIRQDNGAINVLEFDARGARVQLLNETAHLRASSAAP